MPIRDSEVSVFLSTVFGGIDPVAHEHLAARLERRRLGCGEQLWRAGEAASGMAFVIRGRLIVTVVEADGDLRIAGEIGRGQAVGLAELVGRRARVGTVTAVRPTELLFFSGEEFEALVAIAPAFVMPLMRSLATRLSDALRGEQGFCAPETIALVPLDASVPGWAIAEALAKRLERFGSVHLLDAARVDSFHGPGAARSPLRGDDDTLRRWLDARDDAHDTDLYLADARDDPWTRRCLERADRILLIASAGSTPRVQEVERLTDLDGPVPNQAHRELIVVHPRNASLPTGTRHLLAGRAVERLHHLRLDHDGDLGRLARRLKNRGVGLVLSGGAARGMVHIGVIRALTEAGVPIDAVGGASAGGGVGVLFAAEFSPDEMVEGVIEAWVKSRVFKRVRIPIVSLLDTDAVREGIVKFLGERDLEDMWRDCFVVSSNLTRGRLEVIDRGPAWHAMLCTSAIPGLLPPVLRGGDVLVDAGLLDNMPVGVMLRTRVCGEGCGRFRSLLLHLRHGLREDRVESTTQLRNLLVANLTVVTDRLLDRLSVGDLLGPARGRGRDRRRRRRPPPVTR